MNERRVVITGIGVVTSSGIGIEELFENLCRKHCSIKRIDMFDPSGFACQIAGQLEGFSARKYTPKSYRKAVKVMARDIEIAVAAADLAIRDAGIITRGIDEQNVNIDSSRFGSNIGAGLMCTDLDELGIAVNTSVTDGKFDFKKWGREGMENLTPLWLLKYLPNMLACHVTIIHGAKGPSNTITCGEASGHLAVGEASRVIARGSVDVNIAGGAESKVHPLHLLRQDLLGRLTTTHNDNPTEACRPFDANHSGTVIGEGGGLLLLEDHDRAVNRSARIYAEVVGFGTRCDPNGVNFLNPPSSSALTRAINSALADAQIAPEQIDLVIPHGSGVPAEDIAEAQAIHQALGQHAQNVPVCPLTGSYGNLFAGAGAVALAVAATALYKQTIPPAVNFETPDEACNLNINREPIQKEINYVLSTASSIGGQYAAVVLKRYE